MLKSHHVTRPSTLRKHWQRSGLVYTCSRPYQNSPRSEDHVPLSSHAEDADSNRPSAALPLSPVLDPEFIDKKQRLNYKLPKPLQDAADLTDFQKRLLANPYARALATPVRLCTYTHARLPKHFLLTFTTEFRPPEARDKTTQLVPYINLFTGDGAPGPKSSMLNSRKLVKRLEEKKTWQRLISRDIVDRFRTKDKREWRWPGDMDGIVLQHLRNNVLAKLRWAFNKHGTKLVRDMGSRKADSDTCILLLRQSAASVSSMVGADVFDLTVLLGEDLVKDLVTDTTFADSDAVTVTNSAHNAEMRTRLLKLRNFMKSE